MVLIFECETLGESLSFSVASLYLSEDQLQTLRGGGGMAFWTYRHTYPSYLKVLNQIAESVPTCWVRL